MKSSKKRLTDFRPGSDYRIISLSDLSFKVLGTTGTFEIFEISWTTEKASAKTSEEENARLEQEIASLDNKIKLLEEQLEKTEDKLSKTTSDLQMIETVSIIRGLLIHWTSLYLKWKTTGRKWSGILAKKKSYCFENWDNSFTLYRFHAFVLTLNTLKLPLATGNRSIKRISQVFDRL